MNAPRHLTTSIEFLALGYRCRRGATPPDFLAYQLATSTVGCGLSRPSSLGFVHDTGKSLPVFRLAGLNLWKLRLVEVKEPSPLNRHDNWRVRRQDELVGAGGNAFVQVSDKEVLPTRRQGCLWLIEEKEPTLPARTKNEIDGLPMRALAERLSSVERVRVTLEERVGLAVFKQAGEIVESVCPKEERVGRLTQKAWPHRIGEPRVFPFSIGKFISAPARDRESRQLRQRLQQRRFSGAILAHEERDWRRQVQVEAADEWQVEGVSVPILHAFFDDITSD
jgi:hypothetical protein